MGQGTPKEHQHVLEGGALVKERLEIREPMRAPGRSELCRRCCYGRKGHGCLTAYASLRLCAPAKITEELVPGKS